MSGPRIPGRGTRVADLSVSSHAVAYRVPAVSDSVRAGIAEQILPLTILQQDLERGWELSIDAERARQRIGAGLVGYDAMDVIASAGSLLVAFVRATAAVQQAGLSTEEEAVQARERRFQIQSLMSAWWGAEPLPSDRVKMAARRSAAVVGNSILRCATAAVRDGATFDGWAQAHCPCCGGSPEFASRDDAGQTLLCARCDCSWRRVGSGCLGCGETEAPMMGRIATPMLGFQLAICHPCGRYIKEPIAAGTLVDPLIDRVLTAQLDAAAETRGLRL